MSRVLQRYALYAAVAVVLTIFLCLYREGIATQARVQYSSILPQATKEHEDGRFHWEDVPVNYPVKKLTSLSKAKPQRLPNVQYNFTIEGTFAARTRKERQAAVKKTFERCWKAYKDYAWMRDEVAPLSAGAKDRLGGWAATLVDSLDTLWIMGLKEEFNRAVDAAMHIDLGTSTIGTVNVFETNIRHLGGLLSAYDLSGHDRLLEKAKEFGEMLLKAFDTPNHVPVTRWMPAEVLKFPQEADHNMLLAEIGSFTLEFTRLSQLTGDMRWYGAVSRIMRKFARDQDNTAVPGMFPIVVDAADEMFADGETFSLGAMSDSFYEYLPKMYALLGGTDPSYQKLYKAAMEGAIEHSLFKPMTVDEIDILMAGNVHVEYEEPPELETEGQHLACFAGGMFALGGKLFQNETHVKIGQRLTDGCIFAYTAMPTGIMPETFHMMACPDHDKECKWNEQRWKDAISVGSGNRDDVDEVIARERLPKGFTSISDRRYILRPEAIESIFILYRITGHNYLVEQAWKMFQSISKATETQIANAAVVDVTCNKQEMDDSSEPSQEDSMESFWLAETLKYFYLMFSDPSVISRNEWVFNTEAHPLKRKLPAAK